MHAGDSCDTRRTSAPFQPVESIVGGGARERPFRRLSLGQRSLRGQRHEGVEPSVVGLDAVQGRPGDFHRGEGAVPVVAAELGSGKVTEIGCCHGHTRMAEFGWSKLVRPSGNGQQPAH